MTRSSAFLEYLKIHLISLEQDSEELNSVMVTYEDLDSDEYRYMEIEDISLTGQIIATQHLLSVATDIMNSTNERVYV
jgi:hypothetical protein